MGKEQLEKDYERYEESKICPLCGYNMGWGKGYSLASMSHKSYAWQEVGIECDIAKLEEEKGKNPE